MHDENSKTLLRELTLAAGPPGAEDEVRAIVTRALRGVGSISHDRLGSVLCECRGSADAPRVVLDSHLDEVAFMVQSITSEGMLRFLALGGWWAHVLLAQRVDVITDNGRVPGVIGSTPPHFSSAAERERVQDIEKMYIDVGASSREETERLGVRVGDPIVPATEWRELAVEGVLSAKAFDNRVGVSLMCETLSELAGSDHPNTLIGVGAVQEELGLRGAGTSTELSRPDVAVVLEGAPADDVPAATDPQARIGHGPQLRLFDPTAVSNRRLARFVEQVARDGEIPLQIAVRRTGGTNAGAIHRARAGVPTVVIAVPIRYIHSHVGLLRWADYVEARRLVIELARRLDAATVATFTCFD